MAWLAGAVLLHDFVLWPLYAAADRAAKRGLGRPWVAHLRVPAGLSLLLGLVYFPVIAGKGEGAYARVSGEQWSGHVERWLLVCGLLFAASGVVYAVRRYGSRS